MEQLMICQLFLLPSLTPSTHPDMVTSNTNGDFETAQQACLPLTNGRLDLALIYDLI